MTKEPLKIRLRNNLLALLMPLLFVITAVIAIFIIHHHTSTARPVLNVLNWTSYIPQSIIDDFEEEYNIQVNYTTYSSNEELLAKLTSSQQGTYDLIFPSDYMVELMVEQDLLQPLDQSKLENLSNLNFLFLNQPFDQENTYSLPFLFATTVLVSEDGLTSLTDLFDEKYRNSVALLDDERVIISAMLATAGADLNSTDDADLAASLTQFEKLKQNIKAFDSDSPKSLFLTGEVTAGYIWSAEALLAQAANPDLKITYPTEGYTISMDNYCIPVGAKHADSAYLFIDYLLRPEVATAIVDSYPYISPNTAATTLTATEIQSILENGTYVKNVGSDIKKLDRLWAQYK